MKQIKALLLSLFFITLCHNIVWSAEELLSFESEQQRERYLELIFQLRCPKCQNQNVADSNAPIAEDIRAKTYQLINQGYSDQQIIDFMVERYSEFVIYKPQLSIVTVWLWLVPALLLILGVVIVVQLSMRSSKKQPVLFSTEEQARLNELLSNESQKDSR